MPVSYGPAPYTPSYHEQVRKWCENKDPKAPMPEHPTLNSFLNKVEDCMNVALQAVKNQKEIIDTLRSEGESKDRTINRLQNECHRNESALKAARLLCDNLESGGVCYKDLVINFRTVEQQNAEHLMRDCY